ncbi:phenylalanine--tRNA ligase subunit alpha [Candidatus Nomurabacteria bacterium RIFCSPHIGHO2_01_FULL_39_220]|uniref:phenylalanine--tRNA ligase n=1 Tax=Candidatus Nomurabacteria bacterium RIFCSPLOWO2_02_FULL_40_67 TaxID=1801787 RepID=A0A1F6Y5Z2_9BACT|nr:MAG: Phenylalanine-tRNA ligase alpha subunit [Parcubacteria group bacterium GW2011_GWA2_40_37]KKS11273.1 MAG: Phenylalanine-tRNA ligase alpha subunit [Parcubacteria group bacterium GW2011_GWB1_41_5]KKS73278.1 MAG: Phenylalanine-tRNA ligase alpha subunit [Parcubacteria group bacterium GW2011_GWF2_42_7]OGI63230.1 MAG: phenylalanine--tRNA ligase subunit alpha [Candidatus Nomurabacteria bacterium RBG_16_40_11]OGI70757.1 MAG: phenylalanine--tRNA ligase subunit alpha [Candidatus Nomurabacteria bac
MGTEHPLSILANQAYQAFSEMGFEIGTGPELETDWYNFYVLNFPKDHPALDMQDTFWIKEDAKHVLRTHTTTVTARELEKAGKEGRLPAAFISVGKVFRNEATDITHEMQFFQIDGGMVGENITLADLKGVLTNFYKKMLGPDVEIEFRPSFFPFTEPSIEVFAKFKGKWLEMMGAGMLHPNVLRNIGLDPSKVQGFAFGGGLDRIAMIKWDIPDVRLFYQGDLRLNQFQNKT